MKGRYGKYGDLKRKAALRKSRKEKARLQKSLTRKSPNRGKTKKKRSPKSAPFGGLQNSKNPYEF